MKALVGGRGLPNLSEMKDVSELLTRSGYGSVGSCNLHDKNVHTQYRLGNHDTRAKALVSTYYFLWALHSVTFMVGLDARAFQ